MKIDLVKKYGYRVVYTEIDPALFNKEFDNPDVFPAMDKIKQSVKQHGIVWPICATYKKGFFDNHFIGTQTGKEPKIGHGNSRIKAAIELGIKVPVIISDFENKFCNCISEFNCILAGISSEKNSKSKFPLLISILFIEFTHPSKTRSFSHISNS